MTIRLDRLMFLLGAFSLINENFLLEEHILELKLLYFRE